MVAKKKAVAKVEAPQVKKLAKEVKKPTKEVKANPGFKPDEKKVSDFAERMRRAKEAKKLLSTGYEGSKAIAPEVEQTVFLPATPEPAPIDTSGFAAHDEDEEGEARVLTTAPPVQEEEPEETLVEEDEPAAPEPKPAKGEQEVQPSKPRFMRRTYVRQGKSGAGMVTNSGQRQIAITLTPSMFEAARMGADQAGVSFSEMVRQCIAEHFQIAPKRS